MAALGPTVWGTLESASERLLAFLAWLVQSRAADIAALAVIDAPWPDSLDPAEVPWQARTWNGVLHGRLLSELRDLRHVTYSHLFNVRGMGARSILDFACSLESALAQVVPTASRPSAGWQPTQTEPPADSWETLLDVLDEPWVEQVSEADARFADILPRGHGTLLERIDDLITLPEASAEEVRALGRCIPAVRERVSLISEEPLEVALRQYLQAMSGLESRHLDALTARLGWAGAPPTTLQAAGELAGISRERVRQLQQRTEKRFPAHPVVMPALDRALDLLTLHAPLEKDTASQLLLDHGITRVQFDAQCILKVARALGRSPGLMIERVGQYSMLASSPQLAVAAAVVGAAWVQVRAAGVTNVFEVADEAAQRLPDPTELSHELVKELLSTHPDVLFLSGGWFWIRGARSSFLRTVSRKILSVVSPQSLATLRGGVRRAYRLRRTRGRSDWELPIPPRAVLSRYFEVHPDFEIDPQGMVSTVEALHRREELPDTEQIIVEVLRSSPDCVLDRATLLERSIQRGANANTLAVYTTYSPILEHLGTDLWSLRGIRVDPAAVEAFRAVKAAQPRRRRVLDHGWTEEGLLWVAIRLPTPTQAPVFGIPAAVKPYLAGRVFDAFTEGGASCGRITVYEEGSSGGYKNFLARSGADEDDILLARFDLVAEVVQLALLDEDVLEQLSPD